MRNYYRCESGGRHVTVWPCITGESGFYDVVYGDVDDVETVRTETRLTAFESASFVVTELGHPHRTTIDALAGTIERWRDELDAAEHAARVATAVAAIRTTML